MALAAFRANSADAKADMAELEALAVLAAEGPEVPALACFTKAHLQFWIRLRARSLYRAVLEPKAKAASRESTTESTARRACRSSSNSAIVSFAQASDYLWWSSVILVER